MKVRTVKQVLKPDLRKLFLFAIFIAIAVGGKIQAWVFSDMLPKPPLYDLLRPFPIWSMWIFLMIPLALVVLPLRLLGIDVMGGPAWLFIIANIAYFYLLSCVVVTIFEWVTIRRKSPSHEVLLDHENAQERF